MDRRWYEQPIIVEPFKFNVKGEIDVLDGAEKTLNIAQTILHTMKPITRDHSGLRMRINKKVLFDLFKDLKTIIDACVSYADSHGWR